MSGFIPIKPELVIDGKNNKDGNFFKFHCLLSRSPADVVVNFHAVIYLYRFNLFSKPSQFDVLDTSSLSASL